MSATTKRKKRTTTIRLGDWGSELTEAGLVLETCKKGTTHRVVLDFQCVQNAGWLASQALEWLQKRREETERQLASLETDLKNARGQS